MPDIQLTNPAGLLNNPWSTAQVIEEYLYDPTVTAATTGYTGTTAGTGVGLINGQCIILYGGYTVATNTTSATVVSTTAVPVVRRTSIAASLFTMIGVVVNAPAGGYLPGSIVQVVTSGAAYAILDANNVTFGQYAVYGTTTSGAATAAATILTGKTLGVILATTTIASGTAVVPVYINLQ